ncbi:H-2 class I histocompatibility antigen Q9 alpha chain-like [Crotalus adamanteus]|uniref:H-2 class I histocompatibility antigen Q9 alpha chain-like n=1 Tax=Crotalus adamanteus TaxID=8729 RepID=A0AAW1BTD5_CROAD
MGSQRDTQPPSSSPGSSPPPGPDNPPAFPSPPFLPLPPRGGRPGRGFLDGTFAFLSPPVLPVAPGRLPSNNDDTGVPFFYWLSLANHPLLFWVVALLITRSASFSACDFRIKGDKLWIGARMALRSAPLLLLVLVAVALPESCLGASSHSLKYFSSSVSEPSQGQAHFVTVGYVDGQVFVHYDSHSQKMQPRVSWMEKVGKEDPQYWDRNTQRERGNEEVFKNGLETLRLRYNQSEGLHTLQLMCGCELSGDGTKGGFYQFGYNGRTFLAFDKDTPIWVALDTQAQFTQRKWDAIPGKNQGDKSYLEQICIEWLERYLSYKQEMPQWTDPPEVTMSSRTEVEDGMETHVCRLDGFYPREIDASWTRDGEVWLQDTLHGSMAPNADGTFHTWLSIQIDPKERCRYRCHVEHDSLQEPLDVALEVPESNLGLIIGCVFFKRCHGYKKAPIFLRKYFRHTCLFCMPLAENNAGHLTAPLQHNFGLPRLQHKGEKKEEGMGPFLS